MKKNIISLLILCCPIFISAMEQDLMGFLLQQDQELRKWHTHASSEDIRAFEALCSEYIKNINTICCASASAHKLSSYILQDPVRAEWYKDASDKEAKAFLKDCDLRAQCALELQKKMRDRK
ncbi:MAG: hypothetical protein K2X90_00285 [Candidatus Babeliaceae bacterium]|nr:hypothetical protein [Candidatus Babeliaceae bacterium]